MITSDLYGISGAVRAWDSLDAGKKPPKRRGIAQEKIDMCLNCTLETCNGNCKEKPVKRKSYKDPCLTCYSAPICKKNGYICNDKARWKPRNHGQHLTFDGEKAKEMLEQGMKYADIGRALGVRGETVAKWSKRKGLRKNG